MALLARSMMRGSTAKDESQNNYRVIERQSRIGMSSSCRYGVSIAAAGGRAFLERRAQWDDWVRAGAGEERTARRRGAR